MITIVAGKLDDGSPEKISNTSCSEEEITLDGVTNRQNTDVTDGVRASERQSMLENCEEKYLGSTRNVDKATEKMKQDGASSQNVCRSVKSEPLTEDNIHVIYEEEQNGDLPSNHEQKKCHHCRQKCRSIWKPVRTKYNTLHDQASRWQRFKFALLCPPHGNLADIFAGILTFFVFWGVLFGIAQDQAVPGGNVFALLVLFMACLIGGYITTVIRLPPLLGMLVVGCLLRNVPKINIGKDIDPYWSAVLRNMALTVILIRAGLGLDPKALKKLSFVVVRLAFLPCLAECVTAAVASHLLLDFPWEWGFMLGFILAAVSPAVVVPSLLILQERGYGVSKGIPTLVIAASSVDDVLAITGFGVVLGIAFSSGELVWTLFKGPLEAILGVLYGAVLGVLLWYLPHRDHSNFLLFRFIILFTGGLLATFGSQAVDFPGAGPLGCLTMAFVAAYRWRKEGWKDGGVNPVADIMSLLWVVFQPLLFGLIGAEVDISTVQGSTIGMGVATLCIGMAVRLVVSFVSVFGAGLTLREMFFIPFAWMPKATVQAAIGSVALDVARRENKDDTEVLELGKKVLTIAVLVILITAPIGAAFIALTGPRLLTKDEPHKEDTLVTQQQQQHGDVEIAEAEIEANSGKLE